MKRYLIVGSSAAGLFAADALRKGAPEDEIVVVSRERACYNRVLLPQYISNEKALADLRFMPEGFFEASRIETRLGVEAHAVDAAARTLRTSGGDIAYDRLLIACGASSFTPPIPGLRGARGVYSLRTLDDAEGIREAASPGARAVIIGGGLTGLDVAAALSSLGVAVTVIDTAPRMLAHLLDQTASSMFAERFAAAGIELITGAKVLSVTLEGDRATGVSLERGGNAAGIAAGIAEHHPCDFIIATTGVRPETAWLEGAVALDRGVAVDAAYRTSAPDIWAAGDVTGKAMVWMAARSGGIAAAASMLGAPAKAPPPEVRRNTLRYFGLSATSAGDVAHAPESSEEILLNQENRHARLIIDGGRLASFVLVGNMAAAPKLVERMERGITDTIEGWRDIV